MKEESIVSMIDSIKNEALVIYPITEDTTFNYLRQEAYIAGRSKSIESEKAKDERIKELIKCIEDLCGFRPSFDSEFTWAVYIKNAHKLLNKNS